jgi:hypothetical protein
MSKNKIPSATSKNSSRGRFQFIVGSRPERVANYCPPDSRSCNNRRQLRTLPVRALVARCSPEWLQHRDHTHLALTGDLSEMACHENAGRSQVDFRITPQEGCLSASGGSLECPPQGVANAEFVSFRVEGRTAIEIVQERKIDMKIVH